MSSASQEVNEQMKARTDGLGATLLSLLHDGPETNRNRLNTLHCKGSVLFAEGELARGVYVLRSGTASISVCSSEGRVVILRLARSGDVLGLNSVLRTSFYDATVKTLVPCRTVFVPRSEVIKLMNSGEKGMTAVLKVLSHELTELTERARLLLLPQTAAGRLASLMLDWCKESRSRRAQIERLFTQEEMAQMIGSSRETVTRLLADLSKRQIIRTSSDSIEVLDRDALEFLASA